MIGVDNDELLCELSDPPLSSVTFGAERAGFRSCRLARSAHGRTAQEADQHRCPQPWGSLLAALPMSCFTRIRRSAAALRFIHDNAGRPIRVYDVVTPAWATPVALWKSAFSRRWDARSTQRSAGTRGTGEAAASGNRSAAPQGGAGVAASAVPSYLAAVFQQRPGRDSHQVSCKQSKPFEELPLLEELRLSR